METVLGNMQYIQLWSKRVSERQPLHHYDLKYCKLVIKGATPGMEYSWKQSWATCSISNYDQSMSLNDNRSIIYDLKYCTFVIKGSTPGMEYTWKQSWATCSISNYDQSMSLNDNHSIIMT